jgi:hypothetical protein
MRLGLLVSIVLLFCGTPSAERDIERRIVLKRHQMAASVGGRIPKPGDSVVFACTAHAGQRLFIRLQPGNNLVAQALLVLPSGKQEGPSTELSHLVNESGTLYIRVLSREQSSGSFRLYLSLR